MLDWTDRHYRFFVRRISRHSRLYSEMISTSALLRGDRAGLLRFDASEHPLALQLGGSDPRALAECAAIGADYGYDEINLNVGCPSSRVSTGRFGACLMHEPELVARCVEAMQRAVDVPVTVKSRIGVDERDSWEELDGFIETVAQAGCRTFIIHARKAWLSGLSPKQNRSVPPLKYDFVHRLRQSRPGLVFVLNGGICDLDAATREMQQVDGVMLGRVAYHDPYLLAEVDRRFFGDRRAVPSRVQVVDAMLPYIDRERSIGTPLKQIARHILGLFHGMPGARHWRRHLGSHATRPEAGSEVVREALDCVSRYADTTREALQRRHG